MKVLIAEDDADIRFAIEDELKHWGYETVGVGDGQSACEVLERPDAPQLVLLDWMMPRMNGVEVCHHVRQRQGAAPTYIIFLSARVSVPERVLGLSAGADDYLTKPFDFDELGARVQAGKRIVELQTHLAERVQQLEAALAQVRELQGLLPICMYCKNIRDDHGYWQQVETYITDHSRVQFSHGVCPQCFETVVKPQLDALAPP